MAKLSIIHFQFAVIFTKTISWKYSSHNACMLHVKAIPNNIKYPYPCPYSVFMEFENSKLLLLSQNYFDPNGNNTFTHQYHHVHGTIYEFVWIFRSIEWRWERLQPPAKLYLHCKFSIWHLTYTARPIAFDQFGPLEIVKQWSWSITKKPHFETFSISNSRMETWNGYSISHWMWLLKPHSKDMLKHSNRVWKVSSHRNV